MTTPTTSTSRKNIVFLITDQQRFDTIASLGYRHVDTPHLDRLAQQGVAFSRMFVTAPSCAPSRASLFTGLYPHQTGVMKNEDVWRHSWVERLNEAGYRCVNVGKMHTFPYDASVGFHERHVVENKDRGHPKLPYLMDDWDKAIWTRHEVKPDRMTLRDRPDYHERLGAFEWDLPDDLHADNFVGRLAQRWLETYNGAEPFFLQVGFPGPHPPYDATKKHLDKYTDRELPKATRDQHDLDAQPDALKALRKEHERTDHDSVVHLEHPTDEQVRRQRAHYYANISLIDEQVGEIVDALDRRGVLDDTVIIFTSDHGDTLNDHGHSQKWTMYESSVRVPAIAWGPGINSGVVVEDLVSLFDLGATVLELADVPRPAWMQARSLVPALTGDPSWSGRTHVFSEHARDMILTETALMTMVRNDRWKLVEFVDSDQGQLFDLESDPHEVDSLWDSSAHQDVKAQLQMTISRWRATVSIQSSGWAADFR